MEDIQYLLVVGISVYGGHQTVNDAEVLMKDLHHRGNAVSCAGAVGYDMVLSRVILPLIDTKDDGYVFLLGRC